MDGQEAGHLCLAPSGIPKDPTRPRQQGHRRARPCVCSTRVTAVPSHPSPARDQGQEAPGHPGAGRPGKGDPRSCHLHCQPWAPVSAGVRKAPSAARPARCWHVRGEPSRVPPPRTAVLPRLLFTSIWIGALLLPAWASGLCAHPLPDGTPAPPMAAQGPFPSGQHSDCSSPGGHGQMCAA